MQVSNLETNTLFELPLCQDGRVNICYCYDLCCVVPENQSPVVRGPELTHNTTALGVLLSLSFRDVCISKNVLYAHFFQSTLNYILLCTKGISQVLASIKMYNCVAFLIKIGRESQFHFPSLKKNGVHTEKPD